MKAIVTLVLSGILAFWMVAIAILSVQNAFIAVPDGPTLVSLRFLGRSSPPLPFGVVLAAAAATGALAMGGAIAVQRMR
ncbi:MAG: DUF1049 domain-containing protein [Elainellaceae cyanobacterium]